MAWRMKPQRRSAGRSPCGERGLKYVETETNQGYMMSLPVRGAWVEMFLRRVDADGMKSLPVRGAWVEIAAAWRKGRHTRPSLPVRGAWVEMSTCCFFRKKSLSLPVRGAWVEMFFVYPTTYGTKCRSPCGERGLK